MRAVSLEIDGVIRRELMVHADARGDLTEWFRAEWHSATRPVQWNLARSEPNALRGVHVHAQHFDYLMVIEGALLVGLHDLRPSSPSYGRGAVIELRGDQAAALEIPPGVAHGFYASNRTIHIYGVSHYWNPRDEMGCRWDDPALHIGWPRIDPLLSLRDRTLGTMGQLEADLGALMRDHACTSD